MKRAIAAATFAMLIVAVLLTPLAVMGHPLVAIGKAQPKYGPPAPMAAGADPVDTFVIVVSEQGFNGTSGNLNMTVTTGDTVKITFIYGDACPAKLTLPGCDDLAFDNPHQLEVQGYSVKSAVINTAHNESSIQFIAGTDGTFQINCIIDCEGMANMQNGWLAVVEPGTTTTSTTSSGSTTSTTTSTSTTTTTTSTTSGVSTTSTTSTTSTSTSSTSTTSSSSVTTTTTTTTKTSTTTAKKVAAATLLEAPSLTIVGKGLNMSVVLVTSSGKPVAGVPVLFIAQTDFGNSSLGKNFTAASGWAYLAYPTIPTGWTAVFASYPGSSGYNASSVAFQTNALPLPPPQHSVSPYVTLRVFHPDIRLIGVPPAEAAVIAGTFFLVLACLYLVIFSVLGQGIRGHWD